MADIEAAKQLAAYHAVRDNFRADFTHVGIGSGSTIVYVVEAIKALDLPTVSSMRFIPTGYQSRQLIINAGLTPLTFDSLPPDTLMDICFDGADEVDAELNCIKGGGACLYQEKLVATHARRFVCVADYRKLQPRLLTKWPSIPIEVEPLAVAAVMAQLTHELGSTGPAIRQGGTVAKEGPLKTDQGNFIVDAPFPAALLLPADAAPSAKQQKGFWEVKALAERIKGIEGVLSVGIFAGENGEQALARGSRMGGQKPVVVYFGMENGEVQIKRAASEQARVEGVLS